VRRSIVRQEEVRLRKERVTEQRAAEAGPVPHAGVSVTARDNLGMRFQAQARSARPFEPSGCAPSPGGRANIAAGNLTGDDMGAWGTGLYSDDDACDVRDAFRDGIADGVPGKEVTDALLEEWAGLADDPEMGAVLWLALADTQSRLGRLEPRVRERALAAIDEAHDLRRWAEQPAHMRKRKAVLAQLRERLAGPQPLPRRVQRRFVQTNDWAVGELIAYELRSGRFAILRVVGHDEDGRGARVPYVEALDWRGAPGALPGPGCLDALRPLQANGNKQIFIVQLTGREYPASRVRRLGGSSPASPSPRDRSFLLTSWRNMDASLAHWFGLE
jgi:hypothetical protein